jgi:hypothetical protein
MQVFEIPIGQFLHKRAKQNAELEALVCTYNMIRSATKLLIFYWQME